MNEARLYEIIVSPVLTEKSQRISELNQFVFKVRQDATKPEIRVAVEKLFNVKVEAVNTLNVKGKVKMFRGRKGQRSDFKKAIVTLAEGNKIDVTTGI